MQRPVLFVLHAAHAEGLPGQLGPPEDSLGLSLWAAVLQQEPS